LSEASKFLVLGSNSFSGASFADFLLRRDAQVIGVSRSAEPHRVFLPYRWMNGAKPFSFHQLDLNDQLGEIAALLRRERPGCVVNFAAQSMVGESWANPDHWFMTNVVSTVRLHEVLRQLDFIDTYVHVTTPEVYGSTDGFITEETPFRPSTPYAVSRAAADMSLRTYFETYRFPVVFTRAANVYGPGQRLYRIIPRAILFGFLGKRLQLHGGGHSRRSFIHIRDVSDATLRAATDGRKGETYHISTNEIVSVRELVERICKKLDIAFDRLADIVGERLGKDAAYMLDSGKIRKELGWKDAISLDQGLDECIGWVKDNLEALRSQELNYVHKP
jgi:dTDP-glucose 4,6-dehydratase